MSSRARLVAHVEQQLRNGRAFAVLFIDLDKFKPVNDVWGHEIGDELLRQVGERLERAVRADDMVARVGGDEFVVVADAIYDTAAASALADRIEELVSSRYELDVGPIHIGVSVGIALSSHDATVAGLLADADMAMYDAKAERRGGALRSPIDRKRSATERRSLIDDLTAGLGRGEIVAHLQPIVTAGSGELVALEALARWNHPDLGVLRPVAFLDLAEDAGLMVALGDAVLASACDAMARFAEHGSRPQLGINLSVDQLVDAGLTARVERLVTTHGMDPERLVVEITEQAMLAPPDTATGISCDATLRSLRSLGATLSLDDFGTGFSSLSHIRRFPLGSIKIDRSFIAGMLDSREDRAVVEAIVSLAHALSLRAVAEGIESREQLDAVRAIGVDLVQGYFVAEPMTGAEALRWALDHATRSQTARPARSVVNLGT
ncbi:MAG: bifunctional diguanylate cyclase/phosphodiesterase [Ilumatobacteraceae bacterium]